MKNCSKFCSGAKGKQFHLFYFCLEVEVLKKKKAHSRIIIQNYKLFEFLGPPLSHLTELQNCKNVYNNKTKFCNPAVFGSLLIICHQMSLSVTRTFRTGIYTLIGNKGYKTAENKINVEIWSYYHWVCNLWWILFSLQTFDTE